ncbi:metalloregulator ArsR/SmtB family transcription factor [Clostridium thermobutyricum]|uniref:metalloregulator ArsR/SmtB family transcription factor n=1 Tax=Clostridium thermobutyricum TaxID=29372 RepID=UPI003F521547
MEKEIKIFKALGDEKRLEILSLISRKNMCAKGIARHLNITESAVSQQIKVLKEANLIIGYKVGYHIIYDINEDSLKNSIKFIDSIIDNNSIISDTNLDKLICSDKCKHLKCISDYKFKEDLIMKICFPVESFNGLKSIPYGHFGSAPHFVICDVETKEVRLIENGDLGHEHGKCQPIKALSGETVDAVIVGGIGAGAIRKLGSMGIKTFKAIDGDLEENLKAFSNGTLKEFSVNHTCNHDGCSHH